MFCLIEHLDVWILSSLLVGGVCFVLLFVLARCARVEPQRSFHSTDSVGMQMWRRAAKLSSCDVFTPEICYTHTHSQRLTQTHTHKHTMLARCSAVSGEKRWTDGSPSSVGSSAPALARLSATVCMYSWCWQVTLTPQPTHTHTEWCTAAVFNPPPGCRLHTYMLDGRWGVEDVGGGGGGVGATPANTHTDTHRPDVSWLWKVEADHSLWLSTNWAPASRLELRHAAPSTPPPAS